jgi:hypothetical protein
MVPKPATKSKGQGKDARNPDDSMGFPTLEELLEEEHPDFSGMQARKAQLEQMAKTSKTAKDKASARQASLAYDRFFELFDVLSKIKQNLIAERKALAEKQQPKPGKK